MPVALAILAALAVAPVEVGTDLVDAARTEAGLRARVGDDLDLWHIAVTPTSSAGTVSVVVTGPDGSERRRPIGLQGLTAEDRSRELAASLALLMEQPGDRPAPEHQPGLPEPPLEEPPPRKPIALRGWFALGPRLEAGSGLRVEAGPDMMGGLYLLREHVQPIVSVGLAGGTRDGIAVLHTRFGAGAAFGAPVGARERLWLGAHVLGHAMWVRAEERAVDTTWTSSTEVGGLLQYRGRRGFFIGLRSGVDLTLPTYSIRGTRGDLRRGAARFVLGLTFGVVFG